MVRLLRFLVLSGLLAFGPQLPAYEIQPGSASEVVKRLTDTLVETMKDADALGYEGRYTKLRPVILDTHALASIAKYSVGDSWDTLTDEQKSQLVSKFTEYSASAYAGQFDSYDGESFEIVSEQPMRRKRAQVKALLKRPGEDDLKFDYVLTQQTGKWLVLNIIVEGVSDLALKRAQYTSVINREGFAALLAKLSNKIDMYAGKQVAEEETEEEGGILSRITDKLPSISLPKIGWLGGDDEEADKEKSEDAGAAETGDKESDTDTDTAAENGAGPES